MTLSLLHLAAWAAGVAVLVAMLIAAAFVAFVAVINWILAVAARGDREGNEE